MRSRVYSAVISRALSQTPAVPEILAAEVLADARRIVAAYA